MNGARTSTDPTEENNDKFEYDDINKSELINESPRLLRGGTFYSLPSFVRSAIRYWNAPSIRNAIYGFRPSRTYP